MTTDLVSKFFDHSFATRWDGGCTGWTQELAASHAIADLFIWFAYMTIPYFLVSLSRDRKDIPFSFFFLLFSIFIVGCGLTHLMGAITVFYPYYYIDFWVKFVTAVASIGTAAALWKKYPEIIRIPNPFAAVSQTEETNIKLEEANKSLQFANNELEKFVYVASHDLKSPLRGIVNLAAWLRDDLGDNLSEESKKHLRLIQDRATKMNNMIEGILQISRVGRIYIEKIPIDVCSVINDVLEILDKKNFTINIGEMPRVLANKVTFGQIFQNLISNSIKHHTRDDGTIDITVEEKDDFYVFSVQDDGPGVEEIYRNKLFEMFAVKNPKSDSTGIGLALCRKVVELAGGRIWLDVAEKGTKFSFSWPKNV